MATEHLFGMLHAGAVCYKLAAFGVCDSTRHQLREELLFTWRMCHTAVCQFYCMIAICETDMQVQGRKPVQCANLEAQHKSDAAQKA